MVHENMKYKLVDMMGNVVEERDKPYTDEEIKKLEEKHGKPLFRSDYE